MGLPALEFSDCYLDSPLFRERLKSHELELDKTNKFIKELIKDGKALIQALKNLSTAKRKFAESLNEFKFQCIGDAETDDEICIAKSLQEFAGVLQNLEDERTRMIENANDVLIMPLERFRKEQISAAKEAKKKYDKETEKYCAVLEKHLSLSAKKKESHLHEADSQVDNVRQHFYEVSLEYVFKVQEVQERKMFDFVEPLLAFLQGLFTYYHHGYELAKDFNHFKTDLTISIQNTRNRFESTRSEVESLMRKMKENPHEHKSVSQHTMEGYLFVQEKRSFVSSWVKYYCTYHREPKRVTMVLFDQKSGGKVGEEESFILKSCTRRKTDSIEKRFCFDVEAVDRPGVITMQALSEEDRRLWMEAMDGREPVYNLNKDNQAEGMAQLDVIGFNVVKKFIYAVETRGIDEQGLYRIVGVNSRVQKLLGLAMDPKTCADVELDSPEWEIKTITSAIKHYLRMLPAPLMTYQYQRSFIKAAKLDNPEARVTEIHAIVHRLPEKNRQMLELLTKHLANVASHHQQNLMTVANLGVVFGPTLLRPQEETVAAIMDIKFQNIVVEILIENHERIFKDMPSCVAGSTNLQLNLSRRRSTESKAPSCSERPLTLFHTPTHSQKGEKRNSVVNSTASELQPVSSTSNCNSSSSSSNSSQGRTPRHSLTSNDGEQEARQSRPSSLLNPKTRGSIPTSATSPSPTSPRSPSWPMFSAPSSPQPTSSTSSDSSLVSIVGKKARALYACKAEHDSELSFIAGTIFENVHPSREPGWLEGTLDGRTGLIPENYVEFV
ncbi:rho GTPase-activating protein 26 [Myripristis murdjan]|uniref:Rho GTPase-activating protein 26 n=1 Tax=Myripristis murdjan TaxID=586833 RepID=A0A667Y5L6_9TELE|nr:rho GTPase-activating protein 26 [Myripristis murdjan]XP_029924524.1 rho GTPase-activating protein 26 [Myripristis murdjan]XP_029924525.1 rho GTPase-activating protein 26 [Myripristis murdjan]XP_029924526.1 rho GTPase-activating protein 26 [Myripristis murdjan]